MGILSELADIASAEEITASRIDFGLTVVTFNVQRWTSLIEALAGAIGEDFHTEQWSPTPHAKLISSFLDRYNADIIVMQEAWDSGPLLVEMEKLGYFGIAAVDTTDNIFPGIGYPVGSGLAFFSKHPFLQLGDIGVNDTDFTYTITSNVIPKAESPVGELPTGALIRARQGWISVTPGSIPVVHPVPADHVAFHRFENSSGIDSASAKGIALVKVNFRNTPITILGTHLNAGNEATRDLQFPEIDQFLMRNLGPNNSDWGHVFLLGDLNTRGDNESDRSAWDQHLSPSVDPNQTLIRRHFIDTWDAFSYPSEWRKDDPDIDPERWEDRTDPGDTGGIFKLENEQTRIDYVLWHPAENPRLAVAHPRVLPDAVADSGPRRGAALSDHWPYAVQFVTDDDFASLSRPLRIDGAAQSVTASFSDSRVRLATPTSVQWFVVLEPGSYAIQAVTGQPDVDVKVEVYRASNLSKPELPVPGEFFDVTTIVDGRVKVEAPEYRWKAEPIFIKVFQPESDQDTEDNLQEFDLPYVLVVVPLDGSTPERALIVSPGEPVKWEIGKQVQIPAPGNIGEVWFKYATIGPFNTELRPQVLDIHAKTTESSGIESHLNQISIFERTASGIPGAVLTAAQLPEGPKVPAQAAKSIRIQDRGENWKKRLVRIEVPETSVEGHVLEFGWITDLCVVPIPSENDKRQLRLQCEDTTDGFLAGDDDNVRIQLNVDGLKVYPPGQELNIGDFGEKQSRSFVPPLMDCSIGFFDFIDITLIEDDAFLTFGDDVLVSQKPIEELAPAQQKETEFSILITGKGGRYRLSGSVMRYSPQDRSLKPGSAGPTDPADCEESQN